MLDSVGQSLPAFVESDQAAKRGKPPKECGLKRLIPLVLEVGNEPRDEDQIGRTLSEDLIRNVEVAAARISGVGLHRRYLPR
jgi:hypothetical protein